MTEINSKNKIDTYLLCVFIKDHKMQNNTKSESMPLVNEVSLMIYFAFLISQLQNVFSLHLLLHF